MRRGDIVRVAEGKPRPAVVIQADYLPTPVEILICPLTTVVRDAPLYRLTVDASVENGLATTSQLMVDKIGPARRDRIDGVVGRLSEPDLSRLGEALTLMLDIVR